MRKLEMTFAGLVVSSMLMMLGMAFYWAVLDNKIPVRVIYAAPFAHDGKGQSRASLVAKREFHVGETMYSWTEWCRDSLKRGIVKRFFSDTFVYALPQISIRGEIGCYAKSHALTVPNLPMGDYDYVRTITHYINPLIGWRSFKYPPVPIKILWTPEYHIYPKQVPQGRQVK